MSSSSSSSNQQKETYDIETDRAPVGRQWAIKRARKMSPEN
ncbi:hypothetical protein T03_15690 [Trichinella britovi]|uniref:Uncharacterized protein n=1 Tax=Trichinella britovi TaxID=45882 RepID=A0A0V1CY08_TRIBR|nr:hypothetical protein T03_15690 [Trichinella britovi]